MKQINLPLEVDDDFQEGWCDRCPLSYEEWRYDGNDSDEYEYGVYCVLGRNWENCPMKEELEKEKEEDLVQ